MMMKVNFPGLLIEKHRSGVIRYRVRVEGNKAKRISIPVGPDHPDFGSYYWSARGGEKWQPTEKPQPVRRSLDWLARGYLEHLERLVTADLASPITLRQRRSILTRMCAHVDEENGRYGECDMDAPTSAWVRIRDAWAATPAEADNLMKAVRAMYTWAMERQEIDHNPAAGISKLHRSRGGAIPWTASDLKKFREAHPKGTMAHLWLTIHMFTACRIGDAIWLGRDNEVVRDGITRLEWQPRKKGSAPVSIPLLPPLLAATRAMQVQGRSYLLTDHGKPFASAESLRNRVRKWCTTAGIEDRSSHGIRKAVAELLAEAGCTQHQIMAIMAHTQAQTSEIYTKGAQRRILSDDAMRALSALDW